MALHNAGKKVQLVIVKKVRKYMMMDFIAIPLILIGSYLIAFLLEGQVHLDRSILFVLVPPVCLIFTFPSHWYNTYINKIAKWEHLTLADLARITKLDKVVFKQKNAFTILTKRRYQKQVALQLEAEFDSTE